MHKHTRTRRTHELRAGDRIVTTDGRTTRVATTQRDPEARYLYTLTFTNSTAETIHADASWTVVLTNKQAEEEERAYYAEQLRSTLAPHQTIYTSSESTSRNSGTVHVHLYTAEQNEGKRPYIRNITDRVARATGNKLSDRLGIVYGGYGYSKEFQAVYGLGRALYPDGYTCTGKHCRSNDHTNGEPRDGVMHHRDGGYYFTQSSL